jgi:hypothetical protein
VTPWTQTAGGVASTSAAAGKVGIEIDSDARRDAAKAADIAT